MLAVPVVFSLIALFVMLAMVLAALFLFTAYTAKRVEAALPPQGRFVNAAGVTFHVHEQGNGPTLLLIHGLAGQMHHYTYGVAERLANRYRVVAIDRPGSGYSVRPPVTAADLSTQAAAIAALIDKLQLGSSFVVGHSLGGAVALTLAVEHPRHVCGLALVAPLTHLPERDGPPEAFKGLTIASPLLRKLVAWTLLVPVSIARSKQVLDQVFGPEPVPHDFGTRGGGLHALRPSHFEGASRDLQAIPQRLPAVIARYGELKVPISILYGKEDRILDWKSNGQALVDKLPHAQLKLVDGGHMLPVTQPALTADFIRDAAQQAGTAEAALKSGS